MDVGSGNVIIRVEKSNYQGKDLVHIRKYFKNKESGEYLPTKKGIAFVLEQLPLVIEALQKIK